MADELAAQVVGVGALVEPARRALYLHVVAQQHPVSREQAAEAVGLPLHSAKFHLDRLVDEGLLEVEYRRLSGRTGPGAGRPAKLYRRSSRELSVSLPPRRYDLVGEVLASAIDRSARDRVPVAETVRAVAREEGRRLAAAAGKGTTPGRGRARGDLDRTAELLSEHGYEPRTSDRDVCLTNCPFDRLAAHHTELVCGMNLALVEGVLAGLGTRGLTAELAPRPGYCCVAVRG